MATPGPPQADGPQPGRAPAVPSQQRDLLTACLALLVALTVAASVVTEWPPSLYQAVGAEGELLGARAGLEEGPNAQHPAHAGGPEPGARLVFSETTVAPARTPAALPTDLPAVYCHYKLPRRGPHTELQVTWSCAGKPLDPPPAGPQEGGGTGFFTLPPPKAGEPFPEGIYIVRILAGDDVLAEGSFLMHRAARRIAGVAAALAQKPSGITVRSLVFCTELTEEGEAKEAAAIFPEGTRKVYAVFEYAAPDRGVRVAVEWLGDGYPIREATTEIGITPPGGRAHAWIEVREDEALPPGEYTVVIKRADDGRQLIKGRFAVRGSGNEKQS